MTTISEIIRISNEDIWRSSTLEKTDWNKYAVVSNGSILIAGSKKRAKEIQSIINN